VAVEVGVAEGEPDTERVGDAVAVAEAPSERVAVGDAEGASAPHRTAQWGRVEGCGVVEPVHRAAPRAHPRGAVARRAAG
jgi:hypothetical protein